MFSNLVFHNKYELFNKYNEGNNDVAAKAINNKKNFR